MYHLTLDQNEARLIVTVLGQLPYTQSAGLIAKLGQQIRQQDEANAIPVDWGNQWEHAARNLLPTEEFERLQAAVNISDPGIKP